MANPPLTDEEIQADLLNRTKRVMSQHYEELIKLKIDVKVTRTMIWYAFWILISLQGINLALIFYLWRCE